MIYYIGVFDVTRISLSLSVVRLLLPCLAVLVPIEFEPLSFAVLQDATQSPR